MEAGSGSSGVFRAGRARGVAADDEIGVSEAQTKGPARQGCQTPVTGTLSAARSSPSDEEGIGGAASVLDVGGERSGSAREAQRVPGERRAGWSCMAARYGWRPSEEQPTLARHGSEAAGRDASSPVM
jgi:hypothetical protein